MNIKVHLYYTIKLDIYSNNEYLKNNVNDSNDIENMLNYI